MRVAVIVLGDVGRSPRMCYHAASLVDHAADVTLIGYRGSSLPALLREARNLTVRFIPATPALPAGWPRWTYLLYAPVKAVLQLCILAWVFLSLSRQDMLLVQNPPSIPTLLAAQLPRLLRGTQLIIDWHNLGYSVLALRLGSGHLFVKAHRWYEIILGQYADGHITVTNALKEWLTQKCDISKERIVVLYDRPPNNFRQLDVQNAHTFLLSLRARYYDKYPSLFHGIAIQLDDTTRTILTETVWSDKVTPRMRNDRPFVIVSATSWTEDENFNLLLDALVIVDKRISASPLSLPKLLVVITGKGPLRDRYMSKAEKMQLKCTTIVSVWLQLEEYPQLLGCADIGVSLHTSSSGLDLPMKIVDMFGCNLPVCAVDFACLHELVKHNVNGLVFDSSTMLADQLMMLTKHFPERNELLAKFRSAIFEEFGSRRWNDEWDEKARPLLFGDK